MDFMKAREAITQGERAAWQIASQLGRLSVRSRLLELEVRPVRAAAGVPASAWWPASASKGVDEDTAAWLSSLIRTSPGTLDETQIAEDALRIYGSGQYESVPPGRGDRPATVVFTRC